MLCVDISLRYIFLRKRLGAGGDDGGGVGDGDGRAGNAGGSGWGPMDATAA